MADEILDQRSPEVMQLVNNKEDGFNYRRRREPEWLETYMMYRDRVIVNRLTQRQSVHIPMMKQHIRTLLKDMDDFPVIYFENTNNDKDDEILRNAYWQHIVDVNNMELQDIVDKKQDLLFGRTFDQWQIIDGEVRQTIIDPQDILVSRYTDPADINSSRFLIHINIYKPLAELKNDPKYDQEAVKELERWYATEDGMVKLSANEQMAIEKAQKLIAMGVQDVLMPNLGETWVEMAQHYVYDKKDGDDEEQLYLKTEAENQVILYNEPLEKCIGVTEDHFFRTHYNYETWADDVERQDFWSDGVGDVLRTPNKIADVWWSQTVEGRTLRNLGMHFYDKTVEGFDPSTYQPQAFGFYPVPGNPNEIIKRVEIPDPSDNLDELSFLFEFSERASGATSTSQGVQTERKVTLGEVQLALGEAKERIKGISKFYTPAWKRRAKLAWKLIEAAGDQLNIYRSHKKGRNTDTIHSQEIDPARWKGNSNWNVRVWSQEEKIANDTENLQKLNATVTLIPNNNALTGIYQRKLLEFANLTPEETTMVLEEEKAKREAIANNPPLLNNMGAQNGMTPNSGQPNPATAMPPVR